MIFALAYIGLCFIIALLGANRKFGYWGYFLCSLLLTPPVGALVLLGSDPRRKRPKKCPKCFSSLSNTKEDLANAGRG
jgi:hypothetical protein